MTNQNKPGLYSNCFMEQHMGMTVYSMCFWL